MLKQKFVLMFSLIAIMATGAAYATAPSGSESVGTAHTVYTAASNVGTATTTNVASGIAGVTYVNRMVNTAGNAAQAAEAHAAAAGASAITAKQAADNAAASAQEANSALANKQDKSTAVTRTAGGGVGNTSKPVYVTTSGAAAVVTSIDTSLLADATASTKGVAMLGVIPAGTDKSGTASIWVE